MSTAIAAPSPAPITVHDRHPSPRSYAPLAPLVPAIASTATDRFSTSNGLIDMSAIGSNDRTPPGGKKSPLSYVETYLIVLNHSY